MADVGHELAAIRFVVVSFWYGSSDLCVAMGFELNISMECDASGGGNIKTKKKFALNSTAAETRSPRWITRRPGEVNCDSKVAENILDVMPRRQRVKRFSSRIFQFSHTPLRRHRRAVVTIKNYIFGEPSANILRVFFTAFSGEREGMMSVEWDIYDCRRKHFHVSSGKFIDWSRVWKVFWNFSTLYQTNTSDCIKSLMDCCYKARASNEN